MRELEGASGIMQFYALTLQMPELRPKEMKGLVQVTELSLEPTSLDSHLACFHFSAFPKKMSKVIWCVCVYVVVVVGLLGLGVGSGTELGLNLGNQRPPEFEPTQPVQTYFLPS